MNISARILNSLNQNHVVVATEAQEKYISIPSKEPGYGSAINGGELLFLSLATCFCNDLYREAFRRNMKIDEVGVEVTGQFGKEGEPASGIVYHVSVKSEGSTDQDIRRLIEEVDKVAEIHNTLRKGVSVVLKQ